MSYLRYHRILLIGIIVEKCVKKNLVSQSLFLTSCYMKPCHSNNVPSNRKWVPNYEQVNIENHKQSQQHKRKEEKTTWKHEE